MEIRPTTRADIAAVDRLLADSYPVLLKEDYAPSVLVTALPLISKAQPKLVTCGTYYGVFDQGQLVGAGGWTFRDRRGGEVGRIRHVVTDHRRTRQGVATELLEHIFEAARAAGVRQLLCEATRTAVPFYRSTGFEGGPDIEVPLLPGITFPAVMMSRAL